MVSLTRTHLSKGLEARSLQLSGGCEFQAEESAGKMLCVSILLRTKSNEHSCGFQRSKGPEAANSYILYSVTGRRRT